MNNILFRGKRKDTGVWVFGYYCKGAERHCIMPHLAQMIDVKKESVSQWTGKIDQTERKIFFDDIAQIEDKIGIIRPGGVEVAEKHYIKSIVLHCHEEIIPLVFNEENIQMLNCTVIGNTSDNKELLK